MRRTFTPQGWYESPTAGRVHYQSNYEKKLMGWLDAHNFAWQKCKKRFPYVDTEGKSKTYNPDIYLPLYDLYVEVKGMIRLNDPLKFEAFPEDKKLLLLEAEELRELGLEVFDPKTHRAPGNGWPNKILDQISDYSQVGELSEELKIRLKEYFYIFKNCIEKVEN